jgi:hypothetical protein
MKSINQCRHTCTEVGHMAKEYKTDTVVKMADKASKRTKMVIILGCLMPVLVAISAALYLSGGEGNDQYSDNTTDNIDITTTYPEVDLNLEKGENGPGCIEGLCEKNLPDVIEIEKVGSYLAVLRQGLINNPDSETANKCHTLAHLIGRAAVKSGEGVESLLDLDDGRCLYGYQHGVLEGWSLSVDLETLVNKIPEACSAYKDGKTKGGLGAMEIDYAKGSCAHGVGHAISLQNVGTVKEAVMYCSGVEEGQIGGCAGGVFMAYSTENPSQGGEAGSLNLTKTEVETLCNELSGEYQVECWSKLWLLGTRVGLKAGDVAKLCLKGAGESKCARGVGEALYYENDMEADEAISKCPIEIGVGCIYGIAWAEANSWAGSGGSRETYVSVCTELKDVELENCRKEEESALQGAVSK